MKGVDCMQPLLRVVGIRKEFPGVRAVDFGPEDEVVVQSGEIRALVGENGAGKSTFVQMIAGIYEKNSGEIFLEGEPYEAANAVDAQSKGVAIVMQEPALLGPTLTISDNLLLGEENRYDTVGFLNLRKRDRIAKEILERFGLAIFAQMYRSARWTSSHAVWSNWSRPCAVTPVC